MPEAKVITTQAGLDAAPDWNPDAARECGEALHLADSPSAARYFVPTEHAEDFRLVEVAAATEDCRVYQETPQYPMKLRARACDFVREVPRDFEEEMSG